MAETLTKPNSTTTATGEIAPDAPPALTPILQRHAVRLKGQVFTAVPVVHTHEVTLPIGMTVIAHVGDWLITTVDQIVNVITPQKYKEQYELAETGGLTIKGEHR